MKIKKNDENYPYYPYLIAKRNASFIRIEVIGATISNYEYFVTICSRQNSLLNCLDHLGFGEDSLSRLNKAKNSSFSLLGCS